MPTEEEIQERMPVWDALSEFFLDDDLSTADYERIASVLVGSNYAEEELYAILRHEVHPACSLNLICAAGAWGAWGEHWIRKRIAPHHNRRTRSPVPAFGWKRIEDHWVSVRSIMQAHSSAE